MTAIDKMHPIPAGRNIESLYSAQNVVVLILTLTTMRSSTRAPEQYIHTVGRWRTYRLRELRTKQRFCLCDGSHVSHMSSLFELTIGDSNLNSMYDTWLIDATILDQLSRRFDS